MEISIQQKSTNFCVAFVKALMGKKSAGILFSMAYLLYKSGCYAMLLIYSVCAYGWSWNVTRSAIRIYNYNREDISLPE